MTKLFLALLILGFLSTNAQEPSPWTLQKCISYALENNTSVQQNILQGEIAKNNLKQSKLSRIPTLNGSGNHNYNIGRTIDPFTNSFNNTSIQSNSFSISSGVLLYGGSQVNNTIKQNSLAIEANEAGTAVIRNQIALSVSSTFLQIIQAEENLKLAKSQNEITKSQLDRAQILFKNGATNQSTVLNLQAQSANDLVNIINAENAIQIGYNTLMNLMQYPLDQPLIINDDIEINEPDKLSEGVKDIYELALQNLPEVKQAEALITQNQYGEKIARSRLQPTISAYGNVNTVYSQSGKSVNFGDTSFIPIGFTENTLENVLVPNVETTYSDKAFSNQLTDNLGQQVGLSVSVPIFSGYRNRTAVENAKVNTKISELNLQSTKNQLRNDVTNAYTNLKIARSRFEANTQNAKAQKLNFEFSQKRFDAGAMNSVDLLTAKNQWSQAQMQLVNAKFELVFRTLIIDFYKGKELSL
jgi:outer membrane protein